MVDAVQVFPPGYRLSDSSTGAPLQGAVLTFFDAGTTNPKTVYSDNALSVALGTSVTCDALGCPTSDGTTKTHVYVGTPDYKIVVKTSAGVTVETKDNVKGAVVSGTGAAAVAVTTRPVVTKSLAYTVVSADQSTIFAGVCSSGDVTFTLPSAVTVGNGWLINIQHAGSANQCIAATVSGQTISDGSKNYNGFYPLTFNGEEIMLVSDGGNWRVSSHTNPFLKGTFGIIPVVSRLATSPASPGQGDMYIVTAAAGAWATFAIGDIALYTGGTAAVVTGWVNFTPPTNIGWVAYVQAESLRYIYRATAWVAEAADTAAMKAETAARNVTADVMKYHPGVAKAWVSFLGTSAGIYRSYGVSSVTRNAPGDYTINFTTAFSDTGYSWTYGASGFSGGSGNYIVDITKLTSSLRVTAVVNGGGGSDTLRTSLIFWGDF